MRHPVLLLLLPVLAALATATAAPASAGMTGSPAAGRITLNVAPSETYGPRQAVRVRFTSAWALTARQVYRVRFATGFPVPGAQSCAIQASRLLGRGTDGGTRFDVTLAPRRGGRPARWCPTAAPAYVYLERVSLDARGRRVPGQREVTLGSAGPLRPREVAVPLEARPEPLPLASAVGVRWSTTAGLDRRHAYQVTFAVNGASPAQGCARAQSRLTGRASRRGRVLALRFDPVSAGAGAWCRGLGDATVRVQRVRVDGRGRLLRPSQQSDLLTVAVANVRLAG